MTLANIALCWFAGSAAVVAWNYCASVVSGNAENPDRDVS